MLPMLLPVSTGDGMISRGIVSAGPFNQMRINRVDYLTVPAICQAFGPQKTPQIEIPDPLYQQFGLTSIRDVDCWQEGGQGTIKQ